MAAATDEALPRLHDWERDRVVRGTTADDAEPTHVRSWMTRRSVFGAGLALIILMTLLVYAYAILFFVQMHAGPR